MNNKITIETLISAPIEKVWQCWTEPDHIKHWNSASTDWHTPYSVNDLRVGGRFNTRMEAKDGTEGFDFEGTYSHIIPYEKIEYTMDDEREVKIKFTSEGNDCKITETFDPENINSLELQKDGWQSILDNFKKYVESI